MHICMYVCVHVHHVCEGSQEAWRGLQISWKESYRQLWVPWHRCWDWNPSPLEEEQGMLTSEPSSSSGLSSSIIRTTRFLVHMGFYTYATHRKKSSELAQMYTFLQRNLHSSEAQNISLPYKMLHTQVQRDFQSYSCLWLPWYETNSNLT